MAARTPAALIRRALENPAPELRQVAQPDRCAEGYRDTPRPLLAHADPGQLHDAAIERLVHTLLRPVLWPLRTLSGIVSRTLCARGKTAPCRDCDDSPECERAIRPIAATGKAA